MTLRNPSVYGGSLSAIHLKAGIDQVSLSNYDRLSSELLFMSQNIIQHGNGDKVTQFTVSLQDLS